MFKYSVYVCTVETSLRYVDQSAEAIISSSQPAVNKGLVAMETSPVAASDEICGSQPTTSVIAKAAKHRSGMVRWEGRRGREEGGGGRKPGEGVDVKSPLLCSHYPFCSGTPLVRGDPKWFCPSGSKNGTG